MNPNHCIPQGMTSAEREELKSFAVSCDIAGDTQSLTRPLIMIAHWMRQGQRIAFTEYASQWTEAQKDRDDGNHSTPAMAEQWPFSGKRCISPQYSGYYPAGCDGERADDETEIRHAVTVILAEYPLFNRDGLVLSDLHAYWQDPRECILFMEAAKSCLEWLRIYGLTGEQSQRFPGNAITSTELRRSVERYNRQHYPRGEQPNDIPDGAMMAAMVACGYQIKPVSRMNAKFNISSKSLMAAKARMYRCGTGGDR